MIVTMKRDLSHLPAGKQRKLALVVRLLREEFEALVARRMGPPLRNGQILKISLFGSYARGDWVEDPIATSLSRPSPPTPG